MEKVEFVNGCFYHVYNRGVDKRVVYMDKQDYYRMLFSLYEFNNSIHARIRGQNVQGQTLPSVTIKGGSFVDIVCFTLIPNHYHFILEQLADNGVPKFMQKLGTGYTMYFNEKNDRTGRLFESKYKVKLIKTDEYLTHLSRYIHLNCLGLIEPGWKENGIKDWDRANKFLESYKWSSYLDYIGKTNFPNIINKKSLEEYFKTPEKYKEYIQSWVTDDINILEAEDLLFE